MAEQLQRKTTESVEVSDQFQLQVHFGTQNNNNDNINNNNNNFGKSKLNNNNNNSYDGLSQQFFELYLQRLKLLRPILINLSRQKWGIVFYLLFL